MSRKGDLLSKERAPLVDVQVLRKLLEGGLVFELKIDGPIRNGVGLS